MEKNYNESMTIDIPFEIKYTKNDNGSFSCYVPEIGMYYSAKNEEEIKQKSYGFIKIWINFFREENEKNKSIKI